MQKLCGELCGDFVDDFTLFADVQFPRVLSIETDVTFSFCSRADRIHCVCRPVAIHAASSAIARKDGPAKTAISS